MLKEKSGIELGPTKQNMVYARLAKRLRKLGFKTFRDDIEFIGTPAGVDELGTTLNALTTNLTKRTEARRVGKERVSKCRSRWSPDNSNNTCNTTRELRATQNRKTDYRHYTQ